LSRDRAVMRCWRWNTFYPIGGEKYGVHSAFV
jgi:hypothetical protein